MDDFMTPTKISCVEFEEKRSRFIGNLLPVSSEEEGMEFLDSVRHRYRDARHNCWCLRLRRNGFERSSDDGEPQRTAGVPMLGVFKKKNIEDVMLVATRYFGGTLLGTGGLVRAYTRVAEETLAAAGISVSRTALLLSLSCPYAETERIKREIRMAEGITEDVNFADEVSFRVWIEKYRAGGFSENIINLSNGRIRPQILSERQQKYPLGKEGEPL